MADTLLITCPDCKKQVKVPANLAGKKIRCKACGAAVPVTAGQKPAVDVRMMTPEAQAKRAAAMSEEDDAARPYRVHEVSLAPRCPHCAYELDPPDSLICLHCGYNMVKRGRVGSIKTYKLTLGDWMVWHLPTMACILGILGLVGFCLYYHYWLPEQILDKPDVAELARDRTNPFSEEAKWGGYTTVLFYYPIELWLFVFCTWLGWKCVRFAFTRLVFHFRPPEVIKER